MALSSNALIHFTDSKERLFGILENEFKVKYCRETFRLHELEVVLHIPMVSFCDIPFSQIKTHIQSYGRYGIGLSKEWAIRNRLNPVLYVQGESLFAQGYEDLMKLLLKEEEAGAVDGTARRMAKDIARYIKNYEGPLDRRDNHVSRYRYSDEREWRYVPAYSEQHEMMYEAHRFLEVGKEMANASVADLRLSFVPDDIKYLIISSDAEIGGLIAHLDAVKGEKYTKRQIERLTTRILTSEQIDGDF